MTERTPEPGEDQTRLAAPLALAEREARVRAREQAADASDEARGELVAQLREANERLVLAALRADDAASAAVEARLAQEQTQRRLVVAERMASVGTLAAGVAHEINNPLTYVTANLEMVLDEVQALIVRAPSDRLGEVAEMVRQAQEGAERVRKIVRGLKTFAGPERDSRAVLDLREVLDLAIDMASSEVRYRAQVVRDYGAAPPVEADEARLGQVFVNLLVNAGQAIPDGGAERHEIRVVLSTDAAGRAVVEVRDTGPGIPPEVIDRIFDPFFTTKPVGVGTGLGLSICHNIMADIGGEIGVVSPPGSGATFRVTLPPAKAAAPGVPASPTAPAEPRRAAVLVVDNEPAVGFMLARVLRGHDVTVVSSADDALAQLDAGREFDVILSDLMMPGASGMDLYHAITRRFPRAASRVVFISGGTFTPEAEGFLQSVPNERLAKPFRVHDVRALVERFARSS